MIKTLKCHTIESIFPGNEKIAEILIENDADVNLAKNDGRTALHFATLRGNFIMMFNEFS